MPGFFKQLRNKIFGESKKKSRSRNNDVIIPPVRDDVIIPPVREIPKPDIARKPQQPQREPYDVQIGLDFGTAYTKCICRDVIAGDKAWVYLPQKSENKKLPFLMSSSLIYENGFLSRNTDHNKIYTPNSLNDVKMALEKMAVGNSDDPALAQYRLASQGEDLQGFVAGCAIYLLSQIIADIRKDIAQRFPGKLDEDYIAINMAVPIADLDKTEVEQVFQDVLRKAWVISENIDIESKIKWQELQGLISESTDKADSEEVRDQCFLYPEVSANVQCFVGSRNAMPGVYLFSDTGAGTVDQSVFIYEKRNDDEFLGFPFGQVLPVGSGQIERKAAYIEAASIEGDLEAPIDPCQLEKYRQKKENGSSDRNLKDAKNQIFRILDAHTFNTLTNAKGTRDNLNLGHVQFESMKVIFGGGGDCSYPYRKAVAKNFENGRFLTKKKAEIVGMPTPRDLKPANLVPRWFNRLTVAYGLSFQKEELTETRLPNQLIGDPPMRIKKKEIGSAPTKDQC